MRRTFGIVLLLLGAVGLEICGIVLLHWPVPVPGFLLKRLGTFGIMIDPAQAPIWAVLFLVTGIILLFWRRKSAPSK